MTEAGLVRKSDKRVEPEMADERRIYYKLTGTGPAALELTNFGLCDLTQLWISG
jgi:hypothetical protein